MYYSLKTSKKVLLLIKLVVETIESVRSKRVQYGEDVRPFFVSLRQRSLVLVLVAVSYFPPV